MSIRFSPIDHSIFVNIPQGRIREKGFQNGSLSESFLVCICKTWNNLTYFMICRMPSRISTHVYDGALPNPCQPAWKACPSQVVIHLLKHTDVVKYVATCLNNHYRKMNRDQSIHSVANFRLRQRCFRPVSDLPNKHGI